MMADWDVIARDNLRAAQVLADGGFSRSSTSRAYYAAFSAATFALKKQAPFGGGRETPPHRKVPDLISDHLATKFAWHKLRELKAKMRRLYRERLLADYRSGWTVDTKVARQARLDAYAVCRDLGVVT